jgi:putative hydrolase
MKFVLDTHTHTLASGHSYSTIREMAHTANERGLKLLGITEHAPKMPGSCHEFYFQNLKVVDRRMCGVELLLGAELNILDVNGTVDLPDSILQKLDITIASLHVPCMAPGTRLENTKAYVNAIKNPLINIVGHPDDRRYPVDYKEIVLAAKEHHTLIELNNASLGGNGPRVNARPLDIELLGLCAEYSVPIVVGSDAHIDTAVGKHDMAEALLKEVNFPEHLIVNQDVDYLKKYVNRYKF